MKGQNRILEIKSNIFNKIKNYFVFTIESISHSSYYDLGGLITAFNSDTNFNMLTAQMKIKNDAKITILSTKMKTLDHLEHTHHNQSKLLYIANNDGSPRWIWPSHLKKPLFLAFYNSTSAKQKSIAFIIKLVFALRLQNIVFSKLKDSESYTSEHNDWAIFTGTEGPNKKALKLSINKDGKLIFTKISKGKNASKTIFNEFEFLSFLQHNRKNFTFKFPDVVSYKNNSLTIKGIDKVSQSSSLNDKHIQALSELKNSNEISIRLGEWGQWPIIQERINNAKKESKINHFIVDGLQQLKNSFDQNKEYNFCLAHGDLTPWNTFETSNGKLAVIDWELSKELYPLGFDFFHYIFQNGILHKGISWLEILDSIQTQVKEKATSALFGAEAINHQDYLKLFLLSHISYYMELYNEQENWHEQIRWQTLAWSDALVWTTLEFCNRKTFIKQFFAQIPDLQYGILKLGDNDPCEINEGSDIDVLITAKDYKKVLPSIIQNPLVASINISKKSFMSQMNIQFKDGGILHLDFIWQFKRKATTFLNVKEFIDRSYVNSHKVRVTNNADNANYVFLFFSLNNQPVPEKYAPLYTVQDNKIHYLQSLIDDNITADRKAYQLGEINTQKENKGFLRLKNHFLYVLDTFNTAFRNKGFTITFSGVDGAGKSTIIEEVKKSMHEKYRRPIKVLRHRPSILPILSAYVLGRKGAEKKSMESLPREGENKSVISSLFRFMYYYMDYFFGQLIINYKYVRRGYIVIYDRYYYDFINDAKRTNIQLNSSLIKFGFNFLLKPKYNFFLFASPEVILARKKELPKQVILDLTQKYTNLFQDLQKKCPGSNFVCIENIDLKKTMLKILNNIKLKN